MCGAEKIQVSSLRENVGRQFCIDRNGIQTIVRFDCEKIKWRRRYFPLRTGVQARRKAGTALLYCRLPFPDIGGRLEVASPFHKDFPWLSGSPSSSSAGGESSQARTPRQLSSRAYTIPPPSTILTSTEPAKRGPGRPPHRPRPGPGD
jgi:hypothetical protein